MICLHAGYFSISCLLFSELPGLDCGLVPVIYSCIMLTYHYLKYLFHSLLCLLVFCVCHTFLNVPWFSNILLCFSFFFPIAFLFGAFMSLLTSFIFFLYSIMFSIRALNKLIIVASKSLPPNNSKICHVWIWLWFLFCLFRLLCFVLFFFCLLSST